METNPEKIFAPAQAAYSFVISNLKEIYDLLPQEDQPALRALGRHLEACA